MYVPDSTTSGVDTFTYAANDCPTSPQSWSTTSTVSINIVPSQTLDPILVSRYKENEINFSEWSVNTINPSIPLKFTIMSLPEIGECTLIFDFLHVFKLIFLFSYYFLEKR